MPIPSRRRYQKINVIFYFEDILNEKLRRNIESIVERVEGVEEAHFNETQKQLMIVGYDPKRTSSGTILSRVQRQHLNAQLM